MAKNGPVGETILPILIETKVFHQHVLVAEIEEPLGMISYFTMIVPLILVSR